MTENEVLVRLVTKTMILVLSTTEKLGPILCMTAINRRSEVQIAAITL